MEDYNLCLSLQQALFVGDQQTAIKEARKLAERSVIVAIEALGPPRRVGDLIDCSVHTVKCSVHSADEMKVVCIQLKLNYYTKISELKNLFQDHYKIPTTSQYWIISGVIAPDESNLGTYVVDKNFLDEIHLYLSGDNINKI